MNKRIKNLILVTIAILVYCLPLVAVMYVSEQEKLKYIEDEDFNFDIFSYGEVKQVERRDVAEYYIVDLTVTSINEKKLELDPSIEILCDLGDEIEKNQTIAFGISADFDGIITNISYGEKNVIEYLDLNDLVFETYLPENKYDIISSKNLQDQNGNEITVIKKSKILENGNFKAYLSIPDGMDVMYGKTLLAFPLYTGIEFGNVLVVDKACVYMDENEYYVRKVDEFGKYIEDVEVEIGFSDETYICITGNHISEGDYCDAGYPELMGGTILDEND